MALIKCSECGKEISDKATACPGCGAPIQLGRVDPMGALPENLRPVASAPKTKQMSFLLAIGILFVPYVFCWFTLRPGYSKKARLWSFGWALLACLVILPGRCSGAFKSASSTESPSQPAASAPTEPVATPTPAENWTYTSEEDKMRGVTSYWATSASVETKDFGSPYHAVKQLIVLRQQPQDGFQIMLSLTEGQYTCSYSGCSISARFDDGPITKYSVNEATGTMKGILFVQNKARFLSALRGASRVMIEAPFFNQGPQTFEFNVAGLRWEH